MRYYPFSLIRIYGWVSCSLYHSTTPLLTHSYLRLGELYLIVEVQAFPVKFHQNGGGKYGLFQRPYMVH